MAEGLKLSACICQSQACRMGGNGGGGMSPTCSDAFVVLWIKVGNSYLELVNLIQQVWDLHSCFPPIKPAGKTSPHIWSRTVWPCLLEVCVTDAGGCGCNIRRLWKRRMRMCFWLGLCTEGKGKLPGCIHASRMSAAMRTAGCIPVGYKFCGVQSHLVWWQQLAHGCSWHKVLFSPPVWMLV